MLNFLKYTLYKCSQDVKKSAYLTNVQPLLEYASVVWDPHTLHTQLQINLKETMKSS